MASINFQPKCGTVAQCETCPIGKLYEDMTSADRLDFTNCLLLGRVIMDEMGLTRSKLEDHGGMNGYGLTLKNRISDVTRVKNQDVLNASTHALGTIVSGECQIQ